MKLSVSLTAEDVAFLDHYAQGRGRSSRSAAVKDAVALLRASELGDEYAKAWEEWSSTEDVELWDSTVADGSEARLDAQR